MIRKIFKLCLIIIWMGLIFCFSNDTGEISTKKSDGFIIGTIQLFMTRNLTDSEKELFIKYLVVPIRKGAHFLVYFVLGVLVISFLLEFKNMNGKLMLISVFLTFLYACSDEIHQLWIPGRSGQISDVLLDTVSAFLGIMGCKLIYTKVNRRKTYE